MVFVVYLIGPYMSCLWTFHGPFSLNTNSVDRVSMETCFFLMFDGDELSLRRGESGRVNCGLFFATSSSSRIEILEK